MSGAVVITSEMDHLDQLGAKAFAGFLVRKDLVRKYSRQYPVPTYVVEFLLGRYCQGPLVVCPSSAGAPLPAPIWCAGLAPVRWPRRSSPPLLQAI